MSLGHEFEVFLKEAFFKTIWDNECTTMSLGFAIPDILLCVIIVFAQTASWVQKPDQNSP